MASEEARQRAAQCWCHQTTSHLVMEPALCEVIAETYDALRAEMDASLTTLVLAVEPFKNGIKLCLERIEITDDLPTNISIEWNTSYMSAHDLIEALAKAQALTGKKEKP